MKETFDINIMEEPGLCMKPPASRIANFFFFFLDRFDAAAGCQQMEASFGRSPFPLSLLLG